MHIYRNTAHGKSRCELNINLVLYYSTAFIRGLHWTKLHLVKRFPEIVQNDCCRYIPEAI